MLSTNNKAQFGIYIIKQLSTGRFYIGSTSRNFYDRCCKHRSDLIANKHSSIFLQRAWNISGEEDFVFEIIEIINDKEFCWVREAELVKSLDPDFNMSKEVGETRLGHVQSESTKKKISRAMVGIKKDEKFKNNLSKSRKGIGNPQYGKKQSKETIEKRVQANRKKVLRDDGIVYNSISEAAIANNCKYQSISQALRKNVRAAGYRWSYHEG